MYLLIEGDNGTGKDTLAQGLQNQFDIVTYRSEIQQKMDYARTFKGRENALKFMECNALSSRFVEENEKNGIDSIVIRYWPSTIAAAYADRKLSETDCDLLMKMSMSSNAMPDLLVYLECDHDERVHRIEVRNSPNFDDKTEERAARYAYYSKKVLDLLGDRIHKVKTSGKSREEVQAEVRSLINQQVAKCAA